MLTSVELHCKTRITGYLILDPKEVKQDRHKSKKLLDKAFPAVPYSENKHVNVKGTKSPYDGDISYWSQRESKLYNGKTSKALNGKTIHVLIVDSNSWAKKEHTYTTRMRTIQIGASRIWKHCMRVVTITST